MEEAIDAAEDGDEIWVKASTLTLTAPVQVDKAVAIYGGFAGDESERNQRNWHVHPTTFDGQGATACLHVSASVTIDGFVLTRCHNNLGGGALDSQGSITFANNQFLNNSGDLGGAVYNFGARAIWILLPIFS